MVASNFNLSQYIFLLKLVKPHYNSNFYHCDCSECIMLDNIANDHNNSQKQPPINVPYNRLVPLSFHNISKLLQ